MRTVTTDVFTFDELTVEAKKRAIQKCKEGNSYPHDDWYEEAYQEIAYQMGQEGFDIVKTVKYRNYKKEDCTKQEPQISFDLYGHSKADIKVQSVDVSMMNIELYKALQMRYKLLGFFDVPVEFTLHNNEVDYEWEADVTAEQADTDSVQDVCDIINEKIKAWGYEAWTMLDNEYEALTSDEAIREHFNNQEYEFEEDGTRI